MVCWHLADVFIQSNLHIKKIYATIQKFGVSTFFIMFLMEVYDTYQDCIYLIYIYSFSRRFYQKRLTIKEYNKWYIIKRQTVIWSKTQ